MQALPRLLVIRADRLGDVLLSLPSVKALAEVSSGKYQVDFLVQKGLVELLSPLLKSWGVEAITEISGKYRASISLFDHPKFSRSWRHLRIPLRVGLYSKWSSFLCFNKGMLQKRSRAEKSETEYSEELVALACRRLGLSQPKLSSSLLPQNLKAQEELQKKIGPQKPYWVLHPGMGGSAENLSLEAYTHLTLLLQKRHPDLKVFVGIGPAAADEAFRELVAKVKNAEEVPSLTLAGYAELLRGAKFLVAPSTGPLHLAHWVGTKTLGVYSPVRAHLSKRWAPKGAKGESHVWEPKVGHCPGEKVCIGNACQEYFCMDSQVLKWGELELERVFPG